MTWVEPNPTREQVNYWQFFSGGIAVPVAWWPHPNTPRINPRYRCIETQPELVPLASKYGLYYRVSHLPYSEDPQDEFGFWHGDLAVKGDNHIGVTTAENVHGYTLDIDVKHFVSLPENEEPGYEFKTTWNKVGLNSRTYREEYPTGHFAGNWRHNMNTSVWNRPENQFFEFPDAPTIPQFTSHLFAVNECFLFPELPIGFAEFNGSSAYIKLAHDLTGLNQDFIIDVDVRLNDASTFWPVFGRDGQGGFIGMDGADAIFGAVRAATSWTPVEDVWFNWRFEFEQDAQLNYKLFIDQGKVLDTTNNRMNFPVNTIGVYKHGISGTLWADADMRNLKVWTGDAPSTDLRLDLPLFSNALDLGPESNHGTTFNMRLPSV